MKKTNPESAEHTLIPLPVAFMSRIRSQFPDEAEALLTALDSAPSTSVQLHPLKYRDSLKGLHAIHWCERSGILPERPVFTLDPHFHAGAYYPQESSSLFIDWILSQITDRGTSIHALDLCAAPGGKSLLLLNALGPNGRLISNEIHLTRNNVLQENLTRWGIPKFMVTRNEASDFGRSGIQFDLVLVDAPCSGEGMFRKDKAARSEWSEDNVQHCAIRQKSILEDILPCVKPGGYLIYSTCTFAYPENEGSCLFIKEHSDFESVAIDIPSSFQIETVSGEGFTGYRFLPHHAPGEGFFVAVFQRKDSEPSRVKPGRKKNTHWQPMKLDTDSRFKNWLSEDVQLSINPHKEMSASSFSAEELNLLASHFYITSSGISIGQLIREEFIPWHGLAMITEPPSSFPSIDLTKEQALEYLSGGTVGMPLTELSGWSLVRFEGSAIGWVKSIPGRINNYYPKGLRIRMKF